MKLFYRSDPNRQKTEIQSLTIEDGDNGDSTESTPDKVLSATGVVAHVCQSRLADYEVAHVVDDVINLAVHLDHLVVFQPEHLYHTNTRYLINYFNMC